MIPRTRIRHLVGLSKELSLLEDRIADLCEHRHGGTILISGPKGRGKTLLWQTALEAAKRGSSLPCVVSIDLENAPRTYGELLATVQQPGFPWLSKFIVKFIGALPEIAERLTKSHLEEEKGRGDLGFGLFKEVVGMAGRSAPLLLIIENVEAASTMSTDRAIDQIVELIRQNLPILLVITSNEGRLSRESAFLLNERVEVGDAKLCQLPAVSKDDIRDAFSSASKPVLDELYQLAGGDISTFQDLWHECEQLKLIQKGRRGWIWNTEEETDQLGKLTDGAYAALNRITQQCAAKVGDEKLARLALGAAALQGQIFCDEVVANVLWRMGLRLADQYTSDDGHLQKFISLFNNQICDVATNGRLDEGRHFHEFRSILLRHYAKSDIPSEYRKLLREFTAAALERNRPGNPSMQ